MNVTGRKFRRNSPRVKRFWGGVGQGANQRQNSVIFKKVQ